ncbi:histidine-containing phosphotransfer protein 2-like [Durio zibethinus]|uniref:Histidine-containing phosphotransfer protein n=1 Tax=Durio zibethinus TaxID=66656 RepID=A0A6P5XRE4_DURZI|nr:histidine-containing phosphotransfer protein 2-like [Durio zibethinus]
MVGRADHFVQLINMFCLEVESILSQLASYIDLPNVDFSKLAVLAAELGERSSCIGAEHVRLTCMDLMQACDQMQKQKYETFFFLQALSWTKNEFTHTRNKLQVLVQWLLILLAWAALNADGAEDYQTCSKTTKLGMPHIKCTLVCL